VHLALPCCLRLSSPSFTRERGEQERLPQGGPSFEPLVGAPDSRQKQSTPNQNQIQSVLEFELIHSPLRRRIFSRATRLSTSTAENSSPWGRFVDHPSTRSCGSRDLVVSWSGRGRGRGGRWRQKGGPNQQWLSWLCIYTLRGEDGGARGAVCTFAASQGHSVRARPLDTWRWSTSFQDARAHIHCTMHTRRLYARAMPN